jgi:hypothetical protein
MHPSMQYHFRAGLNHNTHASLINRTHGSPLFVQSNPVSVPMEDPATFASGCVALHPLMLSTANSYFTRLEGTGV